jgi:hypothetical protein
MSAGQILLGLIDPGGRPSFSRNVGTFLPVSKAQHPRKPETLSMLVWKHQCCAMFMGVVTVGKPHQKVK